jgi:GntR family transcriptional regulator/MocR family aminotransferase
LHSDLDKQDVLAAFIAEGHMVRHMRRMRALYAGRREVLLQRLREDFADRLAIVPSAAGLHICAHSHSIEHTEAVVNRARQQGMKIDSLQRFYVRAQRRPGILFGYGSIDATQIPKGLALLDRLWRS